MKKTVREAFLRSLPVMAGYIVLGIGFGILLRSKGYGVVWSLAMGLFIYAGSMQYVGVSLIAGGASVLTTILTTLMVNARHLFYSISMVSRYKKIGKTKPYLIFALTDETYSLLCNWDIPEGADEEKFAFFVSMFNHAYWVIGCVLGSALGAVIPFSTKGIEFSMTALFIATVVEMWITMEDHVPAIVGAVCSVICLLVFGSGSFLIPTMISITLVLTLLGMRSVQEMTAESVKGEE